MNTITLEQYENALRNTKLFKSMNDARNKGLSTTYEHRGATQTATQVDTNEFEYVQCVIDYDYNVTYQGSK